MGNLQFLNSQIRPHPTSHHPTSVVLALFQILPGRVTMYDHLELRCPRLGGEVAFSYCQIEGGDIPCPRIITCWQPYFPAETYLRARLTQTQWDRCFNRAPKEKVVSLVELIEAAQKRKQAADH